MNDEIETLSGHQKIGQDLKDMFLTSAGWLAVKDIIEEMRREAFSEWSDLKLAASTEDVISIRAKEKVLKDLLDRIEACVKRGDEAAETMAISQNESKAEMKFRNEKITGDREINRLREPLKRSLMDRLFATTP